VVDPRTGGVTAVQRSGSAINLNVHFHTLTPDGVFELDDDGPACFVCVPPTEDEDVEAVLRRVIQRTAKVLAAYDDESEDEALAALQAAEVDRRLRYPDPFPHVRRSPFLEGFSLHAGVRIHHLDLDSTGPPLAPPRVGPPDSVDPAPAYDVADSVYDEG
jgi:hypothetical protein